MKSRASARTLVLSAALLSCGLAAAIESGCSSNAEAPTPRDAGEDAGGDASPRHPDAGPSTQDAGRDATPSPDDAGIADGGLTDGDMGDASCTGADLTARWARMLASPIAPPNHYANLDLAGPTGTGLTLAEAEAVNCTGPIATADDAGKWPSMTWGAPAEVTFNYDQVTLLAGTVLLDEAPPFTFKSRDGAHTYVLAIGKAATKDGAPFTIDWSSPSTINQGATELDDAVRATFAPSLPADTNCGGVTGTVLNCQAYANDFVGHSYIGFTGPDATESSRIALWVYFTQGTNVTDFFIGAAVLDESDGGTDSGDGG